MAMEQTRKRSERDRAAVKQLRKRSERDGAATELTGSSRQLSQSLQRQVLRSWREPLNPAGG